MASFDVPDGDVRVLWGPVGSKDSDPSLKVVPASAALEQLEQGGAYVVYNPADVRTRIAIVTQQLQMNRAEDESPASRRETA